MIIEMKNIRKSFGSNDVLKDVSFTIKGGEICALLGRKWSRKIDINEHIGWSPSRWIPVQLTSTGNQWNSNTPVQSQEAGIAFIHQELNLINDLPIYENMFLGREIKTKEEVLDLKRMYQETEEIFKQMNVT